MKVKAIIVALLLMVGATAQAQGLGDLLKGIGGGGNGGSDLGTTLGNVISGIFTKSDLTLEDLVGEYKSEGPAVTFKSDNFLQKAGGIAGAAAIETKLQPYYEQYGMIGMPLVIDKDANYSLTIKGIKLNGTVTRNDGDGTFTFNVTVGGAMKIGQFTAYVEKSGKDLNLMFDATKLKELISTVGKFSGMSMAKTMGSILDSYDGMCVGFKMSYVGEAGSASDGTQPVENLQQNAASGLNNLLNRLGNKK